MLTDVFLCCSPKCANLLSIKYRLYLRHPTKNPSRNPTDFNMREQEERQSQGKIFCPLDDTNAGWKLSTKATQTNMEESDWDWTK